MTRNGHLHSPDRPDASNHGEQAEATLSSLSQAIVTTDPSGDIQYMNPAAQALAGITAEQVVGSALSVWLKNLMDGASDETEVAQRLLKGSDPQNIQITRQDRTPRTLSLVSTPLRDAQGHTQGRVISCIERVDESTTHPPEASDGTDPLTGLLNRSEFVKRLVTLTADAATSNRTHALLMLDMDQFKLVNDLSGYRAGDTLLQVIAKQLAEEIHRGDTIARLGGDEFGILLCNLELNESISVARRLMKAIQSIQFTWDGRIYPLGVSIGIVPITQETPPTAMTMSQADAALFTAKDAGRNRYHVYTPNDEELTRRHSEMEWAGRITEGLDAGHFCLALQRISSLNKHDPSEHYEVLLRLKDNGKLVSPGAFIPAAERYGLMGRIDRWVVKAILGHMEKHPLDPASQAQFSINLSGTSLADEHFLEFLTQQINSADVRADSLCFEITETAAITNFSAASRFIDEVHALGCQFSLDDFGSGMSSFGYLRQLPVDYLKIDGVFVRDIDSDSIHGAMVKAINDVGHAMGKKTIAEFVVNQQVLDAITSLGVDYAQGYHIHEPELIEAA